MFLCSALLALLIYDACSEKPATDSLPWSPRQNAYQQPVLEAPSTIALIVASQTKDNTTWLNDVFPDWEKKIYVTDDENATLRVPRNKGREGTAYLTYVPDQRPSISTIPESI